MLYLGITISTELCRYAKCLRVREIKRNKEPGGITSIE